MTYVVTGAMALVDRKDGTTVSVMRGGAVPDDVTEEHLKHLVNVGLVAEDEPVTGLEPTRAGDGTDVVPGDESEKAPAQVAPKDEWVAYAVSQGMSEEDAKSATKAELVEKFKD